MKLSTLLIVLGGLLAATTLKWSPDLEPTHRHGDLSGHNSVNATLQLCELHRTASYNLETAPHQQVAIFQRTHSACRNTAKIFSH
jgi:hypothetical protein